MTQQPMVAEWVDRARARAGRAALIEVTQNAHAHTQPCSGEKEDGQLDTNHLGKFLEAPFAK